MRTLLLLICLSQSLNVFANSTPNLDKYVGTYTLSKDSSRCGKEGTELIIVKSSTTGNTSNDLSFSVKFAAPSIDETQGEVLFETHMINGKTLDENESSMLTPDISSSSQSTFSITESNGTIYYKVNNLFGYNRTLFLMRPYENNEGKLSLFTNLNTDLFKFLTYPGERVQICTFIKK